MQRILMDQSKCGFEWVDVTNPTPEELDALAQRYGLHQEAVDDCLEPDHLPKFEVMGQVNFVIVRVYNRKKDKKADTIQDLSSKIAIFYAKDFLITVHRLPQPLIETISMNTRAVDFCPTTADLMYQIVHEVLDSYIGPGLTISDEMAECEDAIFLKEKTPDLMRSLYYLKRRVTSSKRILLLTKDVINAVGRSSTVNATIQDTIEVHTKALTLYDQLDDALTHLLEIYISLQAQRADEVMRVLTVFSAFFLPLTFVVGVYGMNFQHMPELTWRYGYPACLAGMAAIVIAIYVWFKRRGWL